MHKISRNQQVMFFLRVNHVCSNKKQEKVFVLDYDGKHWCAIPWIDNVSLHV